MAVLIRYFLPNKIAATEFATFNIAEHLVARGHIVHIITTLDEEALREIPSSAASIFTGFLRPIFQFISSLVFYVGLMRKLKEIRPRHRSRPERNVWLSDFLAKKDLIK